MKKSAKIIPVIISIVLLSLLFLNNLKIELTIPAKGWSRPVSLKAETGFPVTAFSFEKDGEANILFPTGTETVHLSVNNKLEVKKLKSLPVSGDTSSPIWFNNGKLVYLKGNVLNIYDGTETKIAEGITAFAGRADIVLFAIDKNLYRLETETSKYNLIATFDHPISKLLISKSTDDALVVQDESDSIKTLTLLHNGNTASLGSINISSSERLDEIDFDSNQSDGLIMYVLLSITQGTRNYIPYSLPFKVNSSSKYDATRWIAKGEFSDSPRDFYVSMKSGTNLLFTAMGKTKGKKSQLNVYEATLVSSEMNIYDGSGNPTINGKYKVERRSLLDTTASKPFRLVEKGKSIAWFGYDGEKYSLYATTSDKGIVEKTYKANEKDYKTATLESVTNIFNSILILLFSFLWMLPSAIIYGILFFVKGHRLESKESWWIVPVAFISYLIMQTYFMMNYFSSTTMSLAPEYLKIPYGLLIWPIVLGLLSYLCYLGTKQKDTTHLMGLSYTIGINLLFVSLLLGVYII